MSKVLDSPIESFVGDRKVAALAGVILEAAAKRSLVVLDDAPTLQARLACSSDGADGKVLFGGVANRQGRKECDVYATT